MDEKRNREVIIIIVSVVVIILVAYLGLTPAVASLKESNYTIKTKGADLKNAEETLDNLRNLQNSIDTKTNEINALTGAMPSFVDAEDMITTLEAIASRNGMQMTSVTPLDVGTEEEGAEATVKALSVSQANYDIIVKGSYQGLQKFMTDLESNRRPIAANRVTISKETGAAGGQTLSSVISITAYYSQISNPISQE